MKKISGLIFGITLTALLLFQSTAHAFNSSSFNGTADFYAGALPPPGLHLLNYALYLDIKKVENKGLGVTDGAGSMEAFVIRPIYVSDKGILGGNYIAQAIIPVVSIQGDFNVRTPGGPVSIQGQDAGISDCIFGAGLSWHTPVWHWAAALDVGVPTGKYDPDKPMNTGHNAYHLEPVLAISGLFPNGIEVGTKLMYTYHFKNSDYKSPTGSKGYQTGQAFHMDYIVDYALTEDLKLGVTGWYWQGLEDDKVGGKKLADSQDFEFSMGPAVRYQSGRFTLTSKYVMPISAENRIEANQFWLSTSYSF